MTALTVSVAADGTDAALHRTVLAGLPNSYRLVDRDAEVVLVSAADQVDFARICSHGTRAVVVDQPGLLVPDDVAAITDTAGRNGCMVVPATRYAPRLAVSGDLLGGTGVDMLESTITSGRSLRSSLVEQLALLRVVLGEASSIRALHISASHYVVEATMAAHPRSRVLLNGVAMRTGVDEASLHSLGAERRLVVRIDAGPVARPAEICVYDGGGARRPWPLHQHSHRITLARLHALLTIGEGNVTYSLDELGHDVQLADVPW